MPVIPPGLSFMLTEETGFEAPASEQTMTKFGANINGLIEMPTIVSGAIWGTRAAPFVNGTGAIFYDVPGAINITTKNKGIVVLFARQCVIGAGKIIGDPDTRGETRFRIMRDSVTQIGLEVTVGGDGSPLYGELSHGAGINYGGLIAIEQLAAYTTYSYKAQIRSTTNDLIARCYGDGLSAMAF